MFVQKQIFPFSSFIEIFKYLNNTSNQMSTKPASILKWSMLLQVWDPYTGENIDKLEMVQRRAAKYVCNNYIQIASVTGMLQRLGWRSLHQRRADICLVFLYKCMNGLVAADLSDQLADRQDLRATATPWPTMSQLRPRLINMYSKAFCHVP